MVGERLQEVDGAGAGWVWVGVVGGAGFGRGSVDGMWEFFFAAVTNHLFFVTLDMDELRVCFQIL